MYYEAETQFHEWLGATLPQHLPETGQMFFLFTSPGTKSPTEAGTDTAPSPLPATRPISGPALPEARRVLKCVSRTGKCNTPPEGSSKPQSETPQNFQRG